MQNTITARRISYNLIALIVLLVVAMFVGFMAGLGVGASSSASVGSTTTQFGSAASAQMQAPTSGWTYRYDSLKNKWYAQHFAMTPTGRVIDQNIELSGEPGGGGCIPSSDSSVPLITTC